MAGLPRWWEWPLVLTPHAEYRMEERGLGEVELRALLQRPDAVEQDKRPDRWMVAGRAEGSRWTVLLEPDEETETVLVITVFRT